MQKIEVIKRNGEREELDYDKIHKVLLWATENITGVSVSEIELKAKLNIYDGIVTTDIHETLINTARDLISEETPNYDKVAGRLEMFGVRKEVYEDFTPCGLYELMTKNIERGYYDEELLKEFTKEEIDELDEYINHDRDYNFRFAGTQQLVTKYLVQDRTTGIHYESPQMMYMLIAMTLFMYDYEGSKVIQSSFTKRQRLKIIKEFYDDASLFKTGLPTPILAGARTPTRQYSSCVVIETDDNLDSLGHTNVAIMRYISKKAGLGLNMGRVRPEGSPVRNGEIKHTGLIPFIKAARGAVKSCSQGGLRGGSATMHFPLWHTDIENLMVLKNNKGTEETRERHLDYSVGISGYFLERLIKGKSITLLSPSLEGLYDAYYEDPKKFKELYEHYEKSDDVPAKFKKTISASKLFGQLLTEGKNTGRVYLHYVDELNRHTPFERTTDPIHQSNLCQEIALPTRPFYRTDDEDGRIALCTLANTNWGEFSNPQTMKHPLRRIVRGLDNILSMQDYPMIQARKATEEFRPLGIGVNNLAYFLAKNNTGYNDPKSLPLVHTWMEHMAYYMQEATIDLAKERGACTRSEFTKRGKGEMLVDTYKRYIDNIVSNDLELDWDALRQGAKEYGVRNATLSATMPSESNSQVMNATNGVEPVRSLVTVKKNRDSRLPIVVPSYTKLKNKYDLLWDIKTNKGYLEILGVIQKFTDQAISVNLSYNPNHYENNEIPMSVLMEDMLYAYALGHKTRYYINTNDEVTEFKESDDVPEELPASNDSEGDDYCEACVL